MQFEHIHLGAGRQGVGVVSPLSCAAGGQVHLVVHRGSRLSPDCVLECIVGAAEGAQEDCALKRASFSRADTIEQLHPMAREALRLAPELLLTTALSAFGVHEQTDFLLSLAHARAERGQRTVFIACEEEIGVEHTRLLSGLAEMEVDVRRCALYRLSSQHVPRSRGHERRAVLVAAEAEWVIEGEADCELLQRLAQAPGVSFSSYVDQHLVRIGWLAGNARLSLALLAAEAKQPLLVPGEGDQRALAAVAEDCREWLGRVHETIVPLVQERCPDLDCVESYAARARDALLEHEDDGLTALRNMRRSTLRPFIRELQRLVGDPWRAYIATGKRLPEELSRLLQALYTVLSDIESYSDYEPYLEADMLLYESVDRRAIAGYEALLGGIVPQQRVAERAKDLAARLKEHRDELPG